MLFCLQNISLGCSCLKSPKNQLLVFLLPLHPSQKALLVQKGAGTEEPGSSRGKTRHRGASAARESPRPEPAGLTTLPQFPCQLGKRMSQFSRARCRGEGGPSAGSMAGCGGGRQGHPQGCWGRGCGAGWVRGCWGWVLPCCVQEAWPLGSTGPLLPRGRRPAHPASGCKCPLGCPALSPGVLCSIPWGALPRPAFPLHLARGAKWWKAAAARAGLESSSAREARHGGFWHFQHLLRWGKTWREKTGDKKGFISQGFLKGPLRAPGDTGAARWGQAVPFPNGEVR